ncbi:hypothetical protein HDG38_002261 [Paraburkholderia sp. WSM4177]|nr:hypothetical protein [Paraburkholderia sp. WSM4177]MBB5484129.1 hypothetical protein [Paraburkholderia sp. WSM4180]
MSALAKDLLALRALPAPNGAQHGGLTEHLMRAIACTLIARGAA